LRDSERKIADTPLNTALKEVEHHLFHIGRSVSESASQTVKKVTKLRFLNFEKLSPENKAMLRGAIHPSGLEELSFWLPSELAFSNHPSRSKEGYRACHPHMVSSILVMRVPKPVGPS
jgi:hypothetical protein